MLIVKPDGTEIDRINGFDGDAEKFLTGLKDYLAGNNTLGAAIASVQNDSLNLAYNYQLAHVYLRRWEIEKAAPVFSRIIQYDPADSAGYHYEANYYLALNKLLFNQDPAPLENIIFNKPQLEKGQMNFALERLVRHYRRNEDFDNAIKIYEYALLQSPDDANLMNRYAWFIYEFKLRDLTDRGLNLAQKATALAPDKAYIWDTRSWLHFSIGNTDSALIFMQKAADLDPESERYKENLQVMSEQKSPSGVNL